MCKAHPGNITEMRQQFVSDQRDFDVEVRHAKRQYWQHQQEELLARRHSPDFWKFFGRIGIQNNIKHPIPWEVVIEDGSISVDHDVVLNKWKKAFEQLFNPEDMQHNNAYEQFEGPQAIHADTFPLNAEITVEEVRFAVMGAAKGKALGDDNILVETLQNEVCIQYFVKLFNTCLDAGTIPDTWGKGIINPILQDVKADQREPSNYRGITITSAA